MKEMGIEVKGHSIPLSVDQF